MDGKAERYTFNKLEYDEIRQKALNSNSLRDGEWIHDAVVEGYQHYLSIVYKKEIKEKNIVLLPWYLCSKVDPDHYDVMGVKWVVNTEVLNGINLKESMLIGAMGDHSHWILYKLCPSERKAQVFDSLRYKHRFKVTEEGIPLLIAGIANFVGLSSDEWSITFPELHLQQTDGFNCGVASLLEMHKLISRSSLPILMSLNDYRIKIRSDLSHSSNELLKILSSQKTNPKQTNAKQTLPYQVSCNSLICNDPHSTNNNSVRVGANPLNVSHKTSFLLKTIKEKYKNNIIRQNISVLTTDLVEHTQTDFNTYEWKVNYKCLKDANANSKSFIGMLQAKSNFLLYHAFIRNQKGKIYDPCNYLRNIPEAQEGLKVLLAEFQKLFGLPAQKKWSIEMLESSSLGLEAGIANLFEDYLKLDNAALEQNKKTNDATGQIEHNRSSNYCQGSSTEGIKWTDPAICGYCGAHFKQKKNLKSHSDSKHQGLPLLAIPVDTYGEEEESEINLQHKSENRSNIDAANHKKRKLDDLAQINHSLQNTVTRSYIEYKVQQIQNIIREITETNSVPVKMAKRDEFSDSCRNLLKSSKSISTILQNFPWLTLTFASEEGRVLSKFEGLECLACNAVRPGCGVFTYNYDLGIEFDRKKIPGVTQHKSFCHLKEKILDHINTKTHRRVFKLPALSDPITPNADVHQEINKEFIDRIFAELEASVTLLKPKQLSKPPPIIKPLNARSSLELLISESKSVKELLKACTQLQLYPAVAEEEEIVNYDGLTCSHCYFGARSGFFQYSSTSNDKKKFDRLKVNIKLHLRTKTHLLNHPEMICDEDKNNDIINKNKEIGLLLGRLAYKAIVSNQSYHKYEAEVAFMADAGVMVGDINHSQEFVRKLRPHFYSALKNHLKEILITPLESSQKASPFTLFADKMSPYGTTFQIIGIVTMIAGENKAIVLSIKPVYNHTAYGIAKDLVETLNEFYPPNIAKTLLVSQSYDGQYVKLGVPLEVIKQLKIPFDKNATTEKRKVESWVTQSWDLMHLIELGVQDVENLSEFEWVKKVQQTIVDINQSHQYGKAWNEFQKCAETLELHALRPGSFSTTRFAAYRFRVYKKFMKMYHVTYLELSKDKDGESELNRINNVRFCLQLSALVDVSTTLSIMSKSVQKSTSFCWEADEAVERGVKQLKMMSEALSSNPIKFDCEHLVSYNDAVATLKADGTYQNAPVYTQNQVPHNTRSQAENKKPTNLDTIIKKVTKKLAQYISALEASISARFNANHNQRAFVLARELFSRDRILERPAGFYPETLFEYAQMAKDANYIQDIGEDQITVEYSIFTDIVHSRFNNYYQEQGILMPEKLFYQEMLLSDSILDECRTIAHLLSAAMARNKSEAVAESIGSQINNHLAHRCMLQNETLNEEIFLHHNAGQYNKACNWIVERALKSYSIENGSDLRFLRTSRKAKLKPVEHSIVIDKIHNIKPLIPMPAT